MTDINPLDNRLEQYDCEQCRQDAGAMRSYMILCPTCGNKRCPKAQNHIYKCTGSNAVGQVGVLAVGHRIDEVTAYRSALVKAKENLSMLEPWRKEALAAAFNADAAIFADNALLNAGVNANTALQNNYPAIPDSSFPVEEECAVDMNKSAVKALVTLAADFFNDNSDKAIRFYERKLNECFEEYSKDDTCMHFWMFALQVWQHQQGVVEQRNQIIEGYKKVTADNFETLESAIAGKEELQKQVDALKAREKRVFDLASQWWEEAQMAREQEAKMKVCYLLNEVAQQLDSILISDAMIYCNGITYGEIRGKRKFEESYLECYQRITKPGI